MSLHSICFDCSVFQSTFILHSLLSYAVNESELLVIFSIFIRGILQSKRGFPPLHSLSKFYEERSDNNIVLTNNMKTLVKISSSNLSGSDLTESYTFTFCFHKNSAKRLQPMEISRQFPMIFTPY